MMMMMMMMNGEMGKAEAEMNELPPLVLSYSEKEYIFKKEYCKTSHPFSVLTLLSMAHD